MARATKSRAESATDVVDILNQSGASKEVARRPVGRPPKGRKVAAVPIPDTSAATGLGPAEDSSENSTAKSNTKLRNPKASASARDRRSTLKKGRGTDPFAVTATPNQSTLPATKRKAGTEDIHYTLEHSAFDPVPSITEGTGDNAESPSRRMRSGVVKVDSTRQEASSKLPNGPKPIKQDLCSNSVINDSAGDESLQAAIVSREAAQTTNRRSNRRQKSGQPVHDAAVDKPDGFACPSPEKASRTREKLPNGATRSDDGLVPKQRAVGGKRRKSTKSTTARQMVEHGKEKETRADQGDQRNTHEEEEDGKDGGSDEREGEQNSESGEAVGADGLEEGNVQGSQRAGLQGEQTQGVGNSDAMPVQNNQPPTSQRPRTRLTPAAHLHDCGEHWSRLLKGAKKNQEKSDPRTKPVQDLAAAIDRFKETLQTSVTEGPDREDEASPETNASNLDEIAISIGNLRKSASRTVEQDKELIKDIYQQAIPRSIDLLHCMLLTRFRNDTLSMSALDQLIMISRSTGELCERLLHWKPKPVLKPGIKKTTNEMIKSALQDIEDKYTEALAELERVENEADAEIRAIEFEAKQERLRIKREQKIIDKQENFAEWVRRNKAERERERMVRSRQHVQETYSPPQPDHEVFDADDLDVYGSTAQPPLEVYDVEVMDLQDSAPQAAHDFVREATEEIPGPTRRVWQKEETVALLLLLQRYRGEDRYEMIRENISEVARDIRKLGTDKLFKMPGNARLDLELGRAGDVLDDLGEVEVAEIEEEARYLKASLAQEMESDIRATGDSGKWVWLSSV